MPALGLPGEEAADARCRLNHDVARAGRLRHGGHQLLADQRGRYPDMRAMIPSAVSPKYGQAIKPPASTMASVIPDR